MMLVARSAFLSHLRVPVPLPSPWFWGMVLLYVLLGLVGHDPWKADDAIGFGIAWTMAGGQALDWLVPNVAGQLVPDEGPLAFWLAAVFIKVLGGLLQAHDAARLATAVWVTLAIIGVHRAARALDGDAAGRLAVLALLACLGLLGRAHEIAAEPAFLAGWALVLWGLALPERLLETVALTAAGLAICVLSRGIAAALPVALAACAWMIAGGIGRLRIGAVVAGLLAGLALCAPWLWSLHNVPVYSAGHHAWLAAQVGLAGADTWRYYAKTILWFTFPAWPVALWWIAKRRPPMFLDVQPIPLVQRLPLLALAAVLASLIWSPQASDSVLLPLLPPLALLIAPGLRFMRRGQAALIDWFGRISFSLAAALIWLGYAALAAGWPERIAANFARLEPGFVAIIHWPAVAIAAAATLAWVLAIARSERTPLRGIVHWCYGTTLTWLLLMTLWLPWIDYGRSYRPVAIGLKAAIGGVAGSARPCVATRTLGLAERASFAYFGGLEFAGARNNCAWLLIQGSRSDVPRTEHGLRLIWEGNRPGDRNERFRLYRRTK